MHGRARDESSPRPAPGGKCPLRQILRNLTRQDIETLCQALRSWIRRTGLDLPIHLAEDLVQEVLLHLWVQDGQMIPYAVDAYLWRAVQNAALLEWRHRRARKRDRRREQRLQKETRPATQWISVETPEQLILYRDQVRHLCQQWSDLFPRETAAALYLTRVLDFTPAEAAAYLGLSPGACKGRLHRARWKLREMAESAGPSGHDPCFFYFPLGGD